MPELLQAHASPSPSEGLRIRFDSAGPLEHRRVHLEGRLDFHAAGLAMSQLLPMLPGKSQTLTLNCAQLQDIDSVGMASLVRLWRLTRARGGSLQLEHVNEAVTARLALYRVQPELPEPPTASSLFERVGQGTLEVGQHSLRVMVLAADVTLELLLCLVMPWRLRWNLVLQQCVLIGSNAAGVISLILFLVGLTLAFQSAYQLRQFGAAIFVAGLTSISMVREMGPLITAILVAGRSGSSITSEVATMRVNEEIDALQVIGIPFVHFVAVPRVFALMLMMPLLTVLADFVGIMGGWIVGVAYLGLGSEQYLRESMNALLINDVIFSLLKTVTFAWGIGIIGLYNGYAVEGGAQEVGMATTRSVVHAIFFIILTTSLFSIVYYILMA